MRPWITQLELVSPGCTLPTTITTRGPVPNVSRGTFKPPKDLVSIFSYEIKFLFYKKFKK